MRASSAYSGYETGPAVAPEAHCFAVQEAPVQVHSAAAAAVAVAGAVADVADAAAGRVKVHSSLHCRFPPL